MTTTTRPCPHCQRSYDISRRMHGDRVYCAPAQDPTADATLVAEMSAMRAELEAVKAEAAALRVAATQLYNQLQALRHPDMSTLWRLGGQPLEDAFEAQKAALISGAGRLLLDELEAARAVVVIARRGFGTAEDVTKAEAFDPVALTRAIKAYNQAIKKAAHPAPEPPSAGRGQRRM